MRPPLSRIHDEEAVRWAALETALAARGLNLVGTASLAAYDAAVPRDHALGPIAPEARTAVVIGNGGGAFWHAFETYCAAHPAHRALADPLDAFTRLAVEEAVGSLLVLPGTRLLYPFRFPDDPVSFMHLAECAGLGRRSLTGVLVHPVFGPWIALRAAVLLPAELHASRPADGFDPCPTCVERSCIAACPAGAVTGRGWDIPLCASHRGAAVDGCASRCHARFECVLGREHRYPADALAYHQRRALQSMRELSSARAPRSG
jgi:hypothetical protein